MSSDKTNTYKAASKYVQQGRLQAAIEEYRKIVHAKPNNTTVLNILGDLYVKVGNKAEAINCFVRIAEYYKQHNSISKAIATLKKALKVEPDSPELTCKLGLLYEKENLWGEARQQYLAAAEQYSHSNRIEEAMNLYQRIIEHDPEKASVQIKLAEVYLRASQPDQAYQAFVAAATDFQQQGRQEEALKIYLQALKAKPTGREALSAAIGMYLQRAETLPAESLLKSLLKSQPDDPELVNLLRRVHQLAHDLKVAKTAISHAVEQDSSNVQYQVELVSASDRACATFLTAASEHQRQGRHEEALQAYLHALKIKPENQAATSAAVNLYLEQGDTRAAVMLLRHLLRGRPDDTELMSLLSQVYYQAKDYDATEQTIGRALVINPSCYQEALDFAALWTRGGELDRVIRLLDYVLEILRKCGEEDKAIVILDDIIARDANHLGALERLATIYEWKNNRTPLIATLTTLAHAAVFQEKNDVAAKALRRLVQLEPEDTWHQRLLQRIGGEETPIHEAPPVYQELPSAVFAPEPEDTLIKIASELEQQAASEAEISEEIHLIEPEDAVVYFPEYHRLRTVDDEEIAKPEPMNVPAVVPPDLMKDFFILSETVSAPSPSLIQATTALPESVPAVAQPECSLMPEPQAQLLIEPQLLPSTASEEKVKVHREQATEIVEITPMAIPTDQPPSTEWKNVAETTTTTSMAPNLAAKQVLIINVGFDPKAFSIPTVWRRKRPLFKKKGEAAAAGSRRGRSRAGRRSTRT